MSIINIDSCLCCGDTLCVRICPAGCFRMKDGKAATVPFAEKMCISCGQCMAICPPGAISLDGVAPQSLSPARPRTGADDFAALLKSRRSVRSYKEQAVPRELLLQALDAVRYAPTGKNRQDVEWLVIEGKERLREIASMVIDAFRPEKSLARLVDAFEQGGDPIFRGAPCAIFAHANSNAYELSATDCSIATGYLELMLYTMGLGSCWAGYALRVAQMNPAIRNAMKLGEDRQIYGALMVGYPMFHYARLPERTPVRVNWL